MQFCLFAQVLQTPILSLTYILRYHNSEREEANSLCKLLQTFCSMFTTPCKKYVLVENISSFLNCQVRCFPKCAICHVYWIFWFVQKNVQNANCKNFQFFLLWIIWTVQKIRMIWYIGLVWIYKTYKFCKMAKLVCKMAKLVWKNGKTSLQNGKTSLQKWHIFLQRLNCNRGWNAKYVIIR